MAKARSRAAARKVKDRWKSKKWFKVQAPPSFDNVTIAETLSSDEESLIGRITEISMQDLTNDFRKSHLLLYFKIHEIEDNNAHTHFVGHSLTSDYLRRMIRRRRSKIEGVYDIKTRDGAKLRIKPFATTDKRIQNSQKRIVRESMKETITKTALASTLSEFIGIIMDGKLGSDIYKNCKQLYPVKRVEIFKTELISGPTKEIKVEKLEKKTEEAKEEVKEKPEKEDKKEESKKEDKTEEKESKEESKKVDKTEEKESKEESKKVDKTEEKESKEESKKVDKTEEKEEKKTSKTKKTKTKKTTAKKTTKKTNKKAATKKKEE